MTASATRWKKQNTAATITIATNSTRREQSSSKGSSRGSSSSRAAAAIETASADSSSSRSSSRSSNSTRSSNNSSRGSGRGNSSSSSNGSNSAQQEECLSNKRPATRGQTRRCGIQSGVQNDHKGKAGGGKRERRAQKGKSISQTYHTNPDNQGTALSCPAFLPLHLYPPPLTPTSTPLLTAATNTPRPRQAEPSKRLLVDHLSSVTDPVALTIPRATPARRVTFTRTLLLVA